jgi:hypothetical protein
VLAGIVNPADPFESVIAEETYVPLDIVTVPVGVVDPDPATATVTDKL